MTSLILYLLYALAATAYIRFYSDTDQPFETMVGMWIGLAIACLLVELISFMGRLVSFHLWKRKQRASSPSPTTQGCTPEGGVSAHRADDNSTGGVTAPEVTWRASGSHSAGGAHE
ncbi:hypothetical protein H9C73_14000 [Marinobacterium sp. AK62]|uniref:Uncharacterized protein n=1 Tax=Marinobacterium alkalitolerans TaxID=1542925 RepID=A0ABS3ZDR3_9GAMM|nr:hypothetical protein [Marinobacterium alkalitolerans]MBP0049841.1 hypothetical protein [Marinobacterium alkalitolerans]